MSGEELFELLNDIDAGILKEVSEELIFWQESQKGISVRLDYSRRFSWQTVIASVACTAAVLFGVFFLLLNIGKIGVIDSPISSDNSTSQSGVIPELPSDTVLFEEAAYAYGGDSDELKRFEIGDKFGEKAEILSAKTTYKLTDGTPVIQKQKIILATEFVAEYNSTAYIEDDNMNTSVAVNYGPEEFGLPSFGKDFEIKPLMFNIKIENPQMTIQISRLEITVDYEAKTVWLHTDDNFITTFKEDIHNEN